MIIKNMWRTKIDIGLWGCIIRDKYMNGQSFTIWTKKGAMRSSGSSYIWRGMTKNFHWMMVFLQWELEEGRLVEIGFDALKGFYVNHSLLANFLTPFMIWAFNILHISIVEIIIPFHNNHG